MKDNLISVYEFSKKRPRYLKQSRL